MPRWVAVEAATARKGPMVLASDHGHEMSFSSSLQLFGEAAVVSHDPAVLRHVDCVYAPFSREVFFDQDPSWGIYGTNGALIEAASYVRGATSALIGQSASRVLDLETIDVEPNEHIYFGPLIPHYGHFLVSSLARAWYSACPEFEDTPLLCHSDLTVSTHFGGYMGVLTSALGLDPSRFVSPTRDVRFTNLTIPGPAFLEQKQAHQAFLEPMQRIGRTLLSGCDLEPNARPVWLSKSRMAAFSVAHIKNEVEIEDALTEHGFDIVFPEQLSIADQVYLFSTRRHIVGFAGSAFHNHIFSQNPPQITCVALDPILNTNFVLLDNLNNINANYYYPTNNIEDAQVPNYSVSRQIRDVGSFISDLLHVVQLPSHSMTPGNTLQSRTGTEPTMTYHENCLPDHNGENYRTTLERLHGELNPVSYLEIGTLTGGTLSLSKAPSIAIDPKFQITTEVIGQKPLCLFYQLESDRFFENYDPKAILGARLDFAFLDGMHRCEFLLRDFMNAERHSASHGVIALHDCLPVEIPMTDRTQNGTAPIAPHRGGWWTGDVWRTVLALKRHRKDLKILCLDAAPTGLVLVSNLNPSSTLLSTNYNAIVEEMMAMDLEELTVAGFMQQVETISTSLYQAPGALAQALGRS